MNIYRAVLAILLFLGTTQIANANFGFGPCCPPSMCGIVPCDSGCAGAALNQMGTNVANALNQLNTAHQNLSDAVQDSIDSMNDIGSDVGDALLDQNEDLLNGLSASTNKIELANNQASKAIERNTDHLVKSFILALKESEVSRSVAENNRIYGDMAQPVSGEIGTNSAEIIKQLLVQSEQLIEGSSKGFIEYISDANNTKSGGGAGQHRAVSLKDLDEFSQLSKMLTEETLEESDFKNLQQLVSLAVSRYPLSNKSNDPQFLEYELERKRYISSLEIIYASFIKSAVMRAGLVSGADQNYYQSWKQNADGKISLNSYYKSEVNGRLTDPEWWGAVMRLNSAGLEREKTYQNAISMKLNDSLMGLSNNSGQLFSLLLLKSAESQSKNLKPVYENL